MFITFINWILNITGGLGYLGIFILMTIESSFLPLPSELVIPPAAWLAGQGKMDFSLIILMGTLGSLVGASINYGLSLWLGRPIVYRLLETRTARILHLKRKNLDKAEEMFLKNARQATFIGRLLPVVRHLISIPAGFSKMPFPSFALFTVLGSFVWVSILTALGYLLGANQDLLVKYYGEIKTVLLVFAAIWLAFFFLKKKRGKS